VLLVVAAGLFAFDRLRGDDGGSGDETAETTDTTAATTTSSTASTTTTVIGTGPLVEVPNVVGQGVFDAADAVTAAGFIPLVERRTDPAGTGTVVEQDPPSGLVPQGSTVKIVFTDPQPTDPEAGGAAEGTVAPDSTDTTVAPF